jgi:hypothetical protein
MLNEDNVEKLRHSLDPVERILRDIMSTDHYITDVDMRSEIRHHRSFFGCKCPCVFMMDEMLDRMCRSLG